MLFSSPVRTKICSWLLHRGVFCSCCEKSRGFALDPEQKSQIQNSFNLKEAAQVYGITIDVWYYNRIKIASLLGLMVGSHENPLDLISLAAKIYISL